VGLTRAKRGLFIVGNINTLKKGKMSVGTTGEGERMARVGKGAQAWRRYAEFLKGENMVIELRGDRLARLLYGNMAKQKHGVVAMKTWAD